MGLFGLIKTVTDVASNVVDVVVAPVEIAADLAKVTTAPLAGMAREVSREVKEVTDEVAKDFKD